MPLPEPEFGAVGNSNDFFNSGLMVLRPNCTILAQLLATSTHAPKAPRRVTGFHYTNRLTWYGNHQGTGNRCGYSSAPFPPTASGTAPLLHACSIQTVVRSTAVPTVLSLFSPNPPTSTAAATSSSSTDTSKTGGCTWIGDTIGCTTTRSTRSPCIRTRTRTLWAHISHHGTCASTTLTHVRWMTTTAACQPAEAAQVVVGGRRPRPIRLAKTRQDSVSERAM